MGDRKIKAVFFDKDGVLINSLPSVLTAVQEVFAENGARPPTEEEFIEAFWGVTGHHNIEMFFPDIVQEEKERIYREYRKRRNELEHLTVPFPDVKDTLEALKGRYRLAVVTNTPRREALGLLRRFDIIDYFDEIVCGDDTPNPKPFPDPLFEACRRLNIAPEQAVFIGDTPVDIQAGLSAGVKTYAVTTGKDKEYFEKEFGVKAIDRLSDIIKELD